MHVEKSLVNSCGHTSWYKIRLAKDGIDIDSDVNEICDVCKREDAEFKTQVAEAFSKIFGG